MSEAIKQDGATIPADSKAVRTQMVEALRLDLVGPWEGHPLAEERLRGWVGPSNEYLTGFLIPSGTPPDKASDADADEDFDTVSPAIAMEEESSEERKAAKKSFFPSSMGLSFLVEGAMKTLEVTVRWGDYRYRPGSEVSAEAGGAASEAVWERIPRKETLRVKLDRRPEGRQYEVPDSEGLRLQVLVTQVDLPEYKDHFPTETCSVSLFLVNHRDVNEERPEEAYIFQAELEVSGDRPLVPRHNPRGLVTEENDEKIADLHYADTPEFGVGHGVAATWTLCEGQCWRVATTWIPDAEVARTATRDVLGVKRSMMALGALTDGEAVAKALGGLIGEYRAWVTAQQGALGDLTPKRRELAEALLKRADYAARRMEKGIALLQTDEDALDAFRMANRSVARALEARLNVANPEWRIFQLAFILLNLPGLVDPENGDREHVDLLFFPTGGGKTEAYLGLAAFAMALRRLRNPGCDGRAGAGVCVIMRYTLRLLTLDQLGRAAGLVCGLELERQARPERYGVWPFEIGLWVGKAATPNQLGKKGDKSQDTARAKVRAFQRDDKYNPAPIPLEECPWCGSKLGAGAFSLQPNSDFPKELRVVCTNFECEFSNDNPLPIVAIDESLYRRLPAFLIATVDKFATLPWSGPSGAILGGATRYDTDGFYGAATPGAGMPLPAPLLPPDLIIQDELHLISGPLGTMAGLYETAIEGLAIREVNGKTVRPKIVASTATVRQAQEQVKALFGRLQTFIFPPPGPNRHDSFFAQTTPLDKTAGRLYVGVAAQGRNPKVVMRRVWLALMGAAQKAYDDCGGAKNKANLADPYMTVLGYFNSLKELGGGRRLLEEEVRNTLKAIGAPKRAGVEERLFKDRSAFSEVVELTSRISTSKVSEYRRRLGTLYHDRSGRVDCAIATNMISVGLDIPRLGLMVVHGQPKSHSEYIQATSRVGRKDEWPGLVVALLNIHKPRDRSHYERFRHYHETFYRSVEVASVTPFASRALDKGLAGALVSYARHRFPQFTPPQGAMKLKERREELQHALESIFTERIEMQANTVGSHKIQDLQTRWIRDRIVDLLDSWCAILDEYHNVGGALQYQKYEEQTPKPLIHDMLEAVAGEHAEKFRVNRSMRDVEPAVNILLRTFDGSEVEVSDV